MGKIHHLKVVPFSDAENRLMELFELVEVKPDSVICRLGSVFGKPYNEYIFSDGFYNQIREYLLEIKGPLASNG